MSEDEVTPTSPLPEATVSGEESEVPTPGEAEVAVEEEKATETAE